MSQDLPDVGNFAANPNPIDRSQQGGRASTTPRPRYIAYSRHGKQYARTYVNRKAIHPGKYDSKQSWDKFNGILHVALLRASLVPHERSERVDQGGR